MSERRSLFRIRMRQKSILLAAVLCTGWHCSKGVAAERDDNASRFAKYAMMLRQKALLEITPRIILTPNQEFTGSYPGIVLGRFPWKLNITTTVFWVGEEASPNNPVANDKSAWDGAWCLSFGGYDTPDAGARRNFMPIAFLPLQNPFYAALPYNDIDDHHTKPEAAKVIPWFKQAFVRDGQSVCKGRWLAIRHGTKVCFAQWEDVGPFATDHWQYVFGTERPRPNRNQDAGLDISPAVRDYLGLNGLDQCDWRFIDERSVPPGPWKTFSGINKLAELKH